MNPVNKKRWKSFKRNRRGYASLCIFIVIFMISLFAELIANDKPLFVIYKNNFFFPALFNYPETTFGGEFELEMEYRQEYAQKLIAQHGWAFWTLIPYSYDTINFSRVAPAPPSQENWLGTDDQGRDVLARMIYGIRISILFALVLTIVSTVIGITVGALQGYFGGIIDLIGQRVIEIWSGMPTLYLLIILSSFITPGFWWLLCIMALFQWMMLVDVVRAECLRGRNLEYVRAAKSLGMSNIQLIWRHILPNAMVTTITLVPFIITGAIATLSSLDFLGFGLPVGSPSLGELIAQGKNNLQSPWLGISAFLVMSILLMLLVFIGEATRDAMDPRKYD